MTNARKRPDRPFLPAHARYQTLSVISPPLDEAGNSVRAQKAIADISNALGGNPLASKPR